MFPSGFIYAARITGSIPSTFVTDWNGLTGSVSVTTTALPEGLNLYFTDTRAKTAVISQTVVNGTIDFSPSEDAVYDFVSGNYSPIGHTHVAADVTDFTTASEAVFDAKFALLDTDDLPEGLTNLYYHTSLFDTDFATKDTDDLAEGVTNLYYTDTRARGAFSAGTNISISVGGVIDATYTYTLPIATGAVLGGVIVGSGLSIDGFGVLTAIGAVSSVFGRTGAVVAQSGDYDSDEVTEGVTNLYFTTARARLAISSTAPVDYDNITGVISMAAADTATDGYLTATDWNTFNGKQAPLTIGDFTEATSSVLTILGGTGAIIGSGLSVQVKLAGAAQSGYLSSTDWNTFNNKQAGLTFGSISSPNTAITVTNGNNATVGPNTTIDVANAAAGVTGLLTGTDWSTFNNKGSVSSVALSLPGIFSVTGSPVTTTGTLTASLANQNANIVFAGPSSGGAAAPTFRALVANDIPSITSLNPGGSPSTGQVLTYSGGVPTWANSSGGGGGGSIQWLEAANASPVADIENNIRIYKYTATETQKLYALIKIPSSYSATQITLKLDVYSGDSSGTNKVITTTTLIRQGTDAMSSTTNQLTTTTTINLGAGTVNKPQAVNSALTGATGLINAVQAAAGDYLLVELSRDPTDTATGDMKIPVYGIDITFV